MESYDEALRVVLERPHPPNVEALRSRGISWKMAVPMLAAHSRMVRYSIVGNFAFLCGAQQFGPLDYNVWAAFSEGLATHTRHVMRMTRRWLKESDAVLGPYLRLAARIPLEYERELAFALHMGFRLRDTVDKVVYLERFTV